KKIFLFSMILVSLGATCQPSMLLDSTMKKASLPEGYSDTKISFRDFSAVATDGHVYTTDSLKGKVTLINFWFEHCEPCIAEFDVLNNLYNKYKNIPGFQFLSITFENNEGIARVAKKHHITYPVLHMEREKIYELIFMQGFPTSIITDQSGKISFIKSGGF